MSPIESPLFVRRLGGAGGRLRTGRGPLGGPDEGRMGTAWWTDAGLAKDGGPRRTGWGAEGGPLQDRTEDQMGATEGRRGGRRRAAGPDGGPLGGSSVGLSVVGTKGAVAQVWPDAGGAAAVRGGASGLTANNLAPQKPLKGH